MLIVLAWWEWFQSIITRQAKTDQIQVNELGVNLPKL
jgi:hypothetical protein